MGWKSHKFVAVVKLLLAGVTVLCVSWIASVGSWAREERWEEGQGRSEVLSTMRTIVAYSEGKQAELRRPLPMTCDRLPAVPRVPKYIWADWKNKAKKKLMTIRRQATATGGGPSCRLSLTATEIRIVHIIGEAAVVGQRGVQEHGFNNRTWYPGVMSSSSWQPVPGTDILLYAAYYDDRTTQRYARILAKFKGRQFDSLSGNQLYCQMRPQNSEDSIEVVAARPLEIWWHTWDPTAAPDVETPLLLSCPLPETLTGPSIVSVVSHPCDDPGNAFLLNPVERAPIKRSFTVCVKDMHFKQDISHNLVEWIETNKILGAEMFDIYIDDVNKNTENVLMYYRDKGIVRLFQVPIKFNDRDDLWQRRRDHIISYNDCLYRNIKESIFIIPMDVDEIIFPKVAYNWTSLLKRLRRHGWNPKEHSAILIRNAFFFDFLQFKSNKMYTKRDDVRINNESRAYNKNKNRISNQVIDHRDKSKLINDSYKTECGQNISVPKFLRHLVRSAYVSPVGYYAKSIMVTQKVLTAFNHYPLDSLGTSGFYGWPAPLAEVQLNHYKETCNDTMVAECATYKLQWTLDDSALRLRKRLLPAVADVICDQINRI